jgi:HPt (histidine-containing phosphotransfer) domain-containing protein
MTTSKERVSEGETPQPVLDLAHLARQTLGDRGLEREVLRLFAQQSVALLAVLAKASGSDDRRAAAHTLKGSARAIGAWRVARAAERFEDNSGGRDLEILGSAVDEANAVIGTMLTA